MDMSTESPRVISDKLIAYVAYHQQKQFGRDIATPIARRYALPLQDPENASFRVLFITQTERRRNDLLLQSRLFPMSNLFHYATMADLKRDPYGTIWYSKETIAPLVDRYDEQSHHLTAVTLRNWAHDAIAHLTPHAL
jgi:hypothetical protein